MSVCELSDKEIQQELDPMKKRSPRTKAQWTTNIEYFIQKFYLIITACPVTFRRNATNTRSSAKYTKSIRFVFFLIVPAILIYLFSIILLRIFWLHPNSALGFWNESSNLCFVMSTCLVIFIETQFTYQQFVRFLLIKQNAENDLLALCSRDSFDGEKYSFINQYWKLLIAFQIFAWILEIFNIFRIRDDPLWMFYCCCLILPMIFTRFRCLQHRFYTGTVNFYVKMIRIKMQQYLIEVEQKKLLAREQNQHQFTFDSVRFFHDICLSKRIFTSAFQMTYLVNKMFGLSLLMNVIENFVQLLSNLFWIYSKLHHQELEHLPEIALRIIPTIFIIIILLSSCELCTKEVCKCFTFMLEKCNA